MEESDILGRGGSKRTLTLLHIFRELKNLNPHDLRPCITVCVTHGQCGARPTVSSPAHDVITHCAYPRRDGQAEFKSNQITCICFSS